MVPVPLPPVLVEKLLKSGQETWPTVSAPSYPVVASFLVDVGASLEAVVAHGTDLYLACACAHSLSGAAEAFDQGPLRLASPVFARLARNPALQDEVLQRIRIKVLVGSPPRIATYSGRGSLASWVRVVGVRIALDLTRESLPVGEFELAETMGLQYVWKGHEAEATHRAEFQTAVKAALETLSGRERTLLRLHFLGQLSVDRLAEINHVHRATVARWLATIRGALFDRVKDVLRERLCLTTVEVRSLWAAMRNELEASVSRILKS